MSGVDRVQGEGVKADRHYGNYRFDVRSQQPPLGLIDNGYAFAAPTREGEPLQPLALARPASPR